MFFKSIDLLELQLLFLAKRSMSAHIGAQAEKTNLRKISYDDFV